MGYKEAAGSWPDAINSELAIILRELARLERRRRSQRLAARRQRAQMKLRTAAALDELPAPSSRWRVSPA